MTILGVLGLILLVAQIAMFVGGFRLGWSLTRSLNLRLLLGKGARPLTMWPIRLFVALIVAQVALLPIGLLAIIVETLADN